MTGADQAARPPRPLGWSRWPLPRGLPLLLIGVLAAVLLGAVLADLLATYPSEQGSLRARLRPPAWLAGGSWDHPLGTDALGRDVYSRILYGARVSLAVGLLAVAVGGAIGVGLGTVAGYFGGRVDAVIMRVTDAASAIPVVLV